LITDENVALQNQVISAGILLSSLIVEHTVSFAAEQHAGKLFHIPFSDSKIGEKHRCSYTKMSAMVS
jgi:hypothetical protein